MLCFRRNHQQAVAMHERSGLYMQLGQRLLATMLPIIPAFWLLHKQGDRIQDLSKEVEGLIERDNINARDLHTLSQKHNILNQSSAHRRAEYHKLAENVVKRLASAEAEIEWMWQNWPQWQSPDLRPQVLRRATTRRQIGDS